MHRLARILFGRGQLAQLAAEMPADSKMLITFGGGSVKKNGVMDEVYSALQAFDVQKFGGIEPNPSYEMLMQAVEVVKREQLLQFAERIWAINEGSEDRRIDGAIAATHSFFEQMGVPTRFSDYQLDGSSLPALLAKLEDKGLTALGERQDITLDASRRIYQDAS